VGDIVTAHRQEAGGAAFGAAAAAILTIAELTMREVWRRRFLAVALGLGAAFVALYGVGLYFVQTDLRKYSGGRSLAIDSGFNMIVMAGLYVVSFLGIMAGVLLAVPAMAGEIASHTVDVLAVKPLRRAALVLGKWLGLACVVSLYVGTLSAGTIGVTWAVSGHVPPNAVRGVAFMVMEAVVLMSITLLGGTRLSVVGNGAMALGLYGLAFIGGWIEEIGAVTRNNTVIDIGIVTSLLVPSEAMWKMAAYTMQPPLIHDLGISPFSVSAPPSTAMLVYTLIYVASIVLAAALALERRDL
jgi:Cu-processing system permease protein